MTRKDYVLIAAAIKSARTHLRDNSEHATEHDAFERAVDVVTTKITKVLKDDNSMFDAARFTQACKA